MDLLPGGRAILKAARSAGSFRALAGCLKGKTNGRVLSIEEINEAIGDAATRLRCDLGASRRSGPSPQKRL